jgi:2-C-methyl-D-erythritol 4-phosphate cytidylyltransferase
VIPSLVWSGRSLADGVVPGIQLSDTVKQIASDGIVQQTLDRSTLRLAQTPQLFKTSVIYDLHLRAQNESGGEGGAFDDAVLAETMGLKILIVEGSQRNMKVTYPEDFEIVSHWARN